MSKKVDNVELISWDSDPLNGQEISVVEGAIGRLPDDYRQFLQAANGARVVGDEVRFPFGPTQQDWLYLHAFTEVESTHPPNVLSVTIGKERMQLIQIAKSPGYSQYLMRLNGTQSGTIYYWQYELEEFWEAEAASCEYLPDEESLAEIASSFTDFVNKLVVKSRESVPKLREMERTVENFAKYGDSHFEETKTFFDAMTLDELNELWPKDDDYPYPPIHYAANWSQVKTSKLLIDRGVDLHEAIMYCTSNFEITRMMIETGPTEEELQVLLLSAAEGISSTSVPEEPHKIIVYLLERGIRPIFTDPGLFGEWKRAMDQTFGKKILSFLLRVIDFPESIAEPMRKRIASRKPF